MYTKGKMDVMFEKLNLPLSRDEILKGIKQLKNNKGAGPDKLLNVFFFFFFFFVLFLLLFVFLFIHGIHNLLPHLDMLFNTIFNHGYFPKEWSLGEIIPLHKKGNINNVENYRGITLLSTLGKLFTSRLTRWAEDYSVSVEARAWFRETMSTTDHIFFHYTISSHII